MPSSSKILRGLHIQGWKVYHPRWEQKKSEGSPREKATPEGLVPCAQDQDEEKRAEGILQLARKEAEEQYQRVLAQAEEEARLLKERAQKAGFDAGYKKGEKEAERLKEEARLILEEAWKKRGEILAGAETEIIQIALNIAEKILDYKIQVDPACILAVMSRSLRTLPAGQNVTLRVNPMDEKIGRENFQRLQELLKKDVNLEISGDEEIPLGSCRVQSDEAEVELLPGKELHILGRKLLALAAKASDNGTGDPGAEAPF